METDNPDRPGPGSPGCQGTILSTLCAPKPKGEGVKGEGTGDPQAKPEGQGPGGQEECRVG